MTTEINTEPKDQTKRKHAIKILEASIAKLDAQIVEHCLIHQNLERKMIARCAELRLQKMLLHHAENPGRHSKK